MESKTKKKKKEGFFKRYWQFIVMFVLLAFAMSQCTKSCSRNMSISKQNIEIAYRDSIIENLELRVDTLMNTVQYYLALYEAETKHNSNFASIATGNQNELYNQMNALNSQILSLQNDKISMERTIKTLNKENGVLRDSVQYYKEELDKKTN